MHKRKSCLSLVEQHYAFTCRLGGLYYLLKAATLAWLVLPQTKVGPAGVQCPALCDT
jgi:hypothetical protein